MKGKDLQKAVIDFAHLKGWKCAHFPSVETKQGWRTGVAADAKGFPDVLCLRDRVVMLEIKGDGDTMKPDQLVWKDRFQRAGVEHYVVTPKDWLDGTVDEILA